jgi:hypothetical protein
MRGLGRWGRTNERLLGPLATPPIISSDHPGSRFDEQDVDELELSTNTFGHIQDYGEGEHIYVAKISDKCITRWMDHSLFSFLLPSKRTDGWMGGGIF